MSRSRTSFVALWLVASLAVACNALLSIRELDATGDADDGGVSFGSGACSACAAASCAAESAACAADPDRFCARYESCIGNCNGDAGCRSSCTIDLPAPASGSPTVSTLSACLASKCETECGLTCGAFGGYLSEPKGAADCQSCLEGNACGDTRACASSSDCDAYWRCYAACPTPDCKFACALQHDAGAALFRPIQQDYSGVCSSACAFGNYWACVGHVNWRAAKSTTVDFTIPVVDFIGGPRSPLPGQTVSICASCPCGTAVDPVLAQGTTDDAGIVTLHVVQPVTSSNVGLIGCAQVESPDGGRVPYFGYWGFPLSETMVDPELGPGTHETNIAAQSAQTFTADEINGASAQLNITQDPSRGLIGAAVFDCLANPSSGAQVTLNGADAAVTTFYDLGDAGSTSPLGLALFYNVPPGLYQVTARPGPLDGGASSVETVNVAPFTTTAVGMIPTPSGTTLPSH